MFIASYGFVGKNVAFFNCSSGGAAGGASDGSGGGGLYFFNFYKGLGSRYSFRLSNAVFTNCSSDLLGGALSVSDNLNSMNYDMANVSFYNATSKYQGACCAFFTAHKTSFFRLTNVRMVACRNTRAPWLNIVDTRITHVARILERGNALYSN